MGFLVTSSRIDDYLYEAYSLLAGWVIEVHLVLYPERLLGNEISRGLRHRTPTIPFIKQLAFLISPPVFISHQPAL